MSELFGNAVTGERPEWTQADAVEFRKFLATAAGVKFRLVLNFEEQKNNRMAVSRIENHAYHSGFAKGYGDCARALMRFSADVQPQSDEDSGDPGAESLAERSAP